ncbi:hypothetical protein [Paraburkholderia saeva]|uniref:Uncharacterized protein n=1 Tax=Paraburkholderia saeva TaxID=2777537 RepID=A0A9N8RSB8_9BURK|nr:hypothetical protein [Paraburkholderia saeva]CAG4888483.1 hypothetical protein LMG31841_00680 [Paraburkholderia saeva]CAG4900438.1 hypothetical protein R70241_02750 [Paraburkholderia saeva]CAG4908163.1 hypothetical protein R52603_03599 [Paraburkholderia saeva]
MARPRIGIFGALMAVGGILAWRWSQRQRAAQALLNRDLNRWEGEGGNVVTPVQPAAVVKTASNGSAANGTGHPAGAGEPWPFPHS